LEVLVQTQSFQLSPHLLVVLVDLTAQVVLVVQVVVVAA
jgi:hypothetical protein